MGCLATRRIEAQKKIKEANAKCRKCRGDGGIEVGNEHGNWGCWVHCPACKKREMMVVREWRCKKQ